MNQHNKTALNFSQPGLLRLSNRTCFSDPEGRPCREFLEGIFRISEVLRVRVNASVGSAEIYFDPSLTSQVFLNKVGALVQCPDKAQPARKLGALTQDSDGLVTLYPHKGILSTWQISSQLPGRIRFRNPALFRKVELCRSLERDLMALAGVDRFRVNPITCSVLVYFDPRNLTADQLLDFLDDVLALAEPSSLAEPGGRELAICTFAVGTAAVAQFAFPILYFPASALFTYCVFPSFGRARDVIFKERRLGVDVLDAIVAVSCLASGQIFAGAVLAWCLTFGRMLLDKAQEDSRRRLLNIFGKQPRHVHLIRDGVEHLVSLDQIHPGDLIGVHTGETIPVDGEIANGMAMVDQHMLTGESVPVEKDVGCKVFASTLLVGGKLVVKVEHAGKDTTTAKISAILNETATFRLTSQSRGEVLADRAVVPTLALGALGFGMINFHAATAIVNCDFGTGIRMAAPLALLSSLSACSNQGILVKDGRSLEQMADIDTVVFDKTGTLTKERPTVGRIFTFGSLSPETVLAYAAAAEQRLGHPIAQAIVERFRELGRPFPETDHSSYAIGFGIRVHAEGHTVLVGSARYMRMEGIRVPTSATEAEQSVHSTGGSIVFVAVDDAVEGALELAPSLREGVLEMMHGLRERGVTQLIIISGDHDGPTRRLAQSLGVDRYFAEVLPADKAKYVKLLQDEGRRVCFVGDGINDSIALKQADVSVSLRGATTVATDTAQIVFMENNLWKLCEFRDISLRLKENVRTSWRLILVPNLLCIAGAFFLGFGVMASVLANNVAAIAALANGLRPLRTRQATTKPHGQPRALGFPPGSTQTRALNPRIVSPPATMVACRNTPAVPTSSPKPVPTSRRAILVAGVLGLILPGVPGAPLILIAFLGSSRAKRNTSRLNSWMMAKFSGVSLEADRFASVLAKDLVRNFPPTTLRSRDIELVEDAVEVAKVVTES